MKLRSVIFSATLGAFVGGAAPVSAVVATNPLASPIVCPASVTVSLTADHASQGWTGSVTASGSFKKAEVINAVGLSAPSLSCIYAVGALSPQEVGRMTRPEPAGMLCTVNAVKNSEFDCFPRPGANSEAATPSTHH